MRTIEPESMTETEKEIHVSAEALCSLKELQEDGEPNILEEVIGIFLEFSPSKIKAILNDIEIYNSSQLYENAHGFKSTSYYIGANRLAELSRNISYMGKACEFSKAKEAFPDLIAEYEFILPVYRSLMKAQDCRDICEIVAKFNPEKGPKEKYQHTLPKHTATKQLIKNKIEIENNKTILILESIGDGITRNSNRIIKRSPAFKDLNFEFLYAVELEKPEKVQTFDIDDINFLDVLNLFKMLDLKIRDLNPAILLIHTGIIFHKFPLEMISVLLDIKSKYSYLKIGSQHNTTYIEKLLKEKNINHKHLEALKIDEIFHNSEDIIALFNRFGYRFIESRYLR